jgi:hypothetical protein
MKKNRPYIYEVSGTGEFPEYMLRYDNSKPFTADDRKIVEARYGTDDNVFFDDNRHLRTLRVKLISEYAPPITSADRWRSFMWKITKPPVPIADKQIQGMPRPELTLGALTTTIGVVLRELQLGDGSVRRSSAYDDYVTVEFATFTSPAVEMVVKRHFETLCKRHGWDVCRVTLSRSNSVAVTLQKNDVITTSNKRMAM